MKKTVHDIIVEWYDEMIKVNEDSENYESCAYFKSSKEAFIDFKEKGTVLYRGEYYTPKEIIELLDK
jgi:hypothetical protein